MSFRTSSIFWPTFFLRHKKRWYKKIGKNNLPEAIAVVVKLEDALENQPTKKLQIILIMAEHTNEQKNQRQVEQLHGQ